MPYWASAKTWNDYVNLFCMATRNHRALAEASTWYLYAPGVAAEIARRIPDARLVAILRQPIDRALSAYQFRVSNGEEDAPTFEEALRLEPERIARRDWFGSHYLRAGIYMPQIQEYLRHFPKEQLLVLLYDDFCSDPTTIIRKCCEHYHIDPMFSFNINRENVTKPPRSLMLKRLLAGRLPIGRYLRLLLPTAVRKPLVAKLKSANTLPTRKTCQADYDQHLPYFEEDIRQLEAFLGRDLSRWRKPVTKP
jgi:hypothetical protein